MTVCDESTRDALVAALRESGKSQRAWARWHEASVSAVNDCLRRKSMSEKRENKLRWSLGLPPIYRTQVTLRDTERIVKKPGHGKKRNYVEFKIRVSPGDAETIQDRINCLELRSFNHLWDVSGWMDELRDWDC